MTILPDTRLCRCGLAADSIAGEGQLNRLLFDTNYFNLRGLNRMSQKYLSRKRGIEHLTTRVLLYSYVQSERSHVTALAVILFVRNLE